MDIEFIEADQIWVDEKTNYWFNVDGENYAISDQCGELTLLNSEGCPIDKCNDHDRIYDILFPLYQYHANNP